MVREVVAFKILICLKLEGFEIIITRKKKLRLFMLVFIRCTVFPRPM